MKEIDMPDIEMVEVGPRDGLQNESVLFSTSQKLELIARALDAGVRRIEATSFVNPKLVPQMADADAVAAGLQRRDGVIFIGLVLNKRGALRAIEAGMDELGAVCAASDGFAARNQGKTSDASLAMCCEVVRLARAHGRRAQITISTAFGCPFDGEVDPLRVVEMARAAAAVSHDHVVTIAKRAIGACFHELEQSWTRRADRIERFAEADDKQCQSYGLQPGTAPYADCRLKLNKQHQASWFQ